jgi:hypothetical protein
MITILASCNNKIAKLILKNAQKSVKYILYIQPKMRFCMFLRVRFEIKFVKILRIINFVLLLIRHEMS